MKIINSFIVIAVLLSLNPCFAEGEVNTFSKLAVGGMRDPKTARFDDELASNVLIELGASTVRSIVKVGNSYQYYLWGGQNLALFDMRQKKRIGLWSVESAGYCPAGMQACPPIWWAKRWSEDEVLEKETIFMTKGMYRSIEFNSTSQNRRLQGSDFMGCLKDASLRYGDIDGDGVNEVIVLLEREYSLDLIIFSTTLNKTIFATMLYVNDSVEAKDVPKERIEKSLLDPQQYWLRSDFERDYWRVEHPGFKSFAKLYTEDFDGDSNFDVILWRKRYQSKPESDDIKGFDLKEEMFAHYELIGGEYRLQKTSASIIEKWMGVNEITWQQGFPNKSECPSVSGKLIPELHDVLLNEPDVLK